MKNSLKYTPADKYFSWCVRERAEWTCERCGKIYVPPTVALQCAHYQTRDCWGTRLEPLNAFALCHGCHQYFDKGRRVEFDNLHVRVFGSYARDIVREKAQDITIGKTAKRTKGKGEIARHYKSEYERMLEIRAGGVRGRLEFKAFI